MKLQGRLRDGSAFEQNVSVKTRRLRLYQAKELAWLDLSALAACPNLENLEMAVMNCVDVPSLAPFTGCQKLTDLSLSIPATTDLAPLWECTALKHLHLRLFGDEIVDLSAAGHTGLESLGTY